MALRLQFFVGMAVFLKKRAPWIPMLLVVVSLGFGATQWWSKAHQGPSSRKTVGYLVKNGREYWAIWRPAGGHYRAFRFQRLTEAVRHFEKLNLVLANKTPVDRRMVRLWLDTTSARKTRLFWKTQGSPYTHRLTFQNRIEAVYFFRAFEQGFYSPSLFGHSILFEGSRNLRVF